MPEISKWDIHGTQYDVADAAARSSITSLQTAVGGKAANAMVADVYDATATYAIGDYCIYDGSLYICSTAISTAEVWTAAHWTATTIMDELSSLFADEGDPVT